MAGASVITSGEIQRQQPGSIADMLQNVPGVASEVTPNDPGQSINIRGMQDFGRVNVLIDGARQDYQISGHNANGTFYLDPQFVGQADVVRGPVSNIYGSGGIGGVVSFNTLGVDNVLNPDEKYGALQRFVVGTNGSGVVTSTSGAARVGPNVDIYGQFLYRNSSSYADGNGNMVPDSGSSVIGGLFKLNVRPSEGQQISLSALTQNDQFANNGTSTEGAQFNNNVSYRNLHAGLHLQGALDAAHRPQFARLLHDDPEPSDVCRAGRRGGLQRAWRSSLAIRWRTRSTATASTSTTRLVSRLACSTMR